MNMRPVQCPKCKNTNESVLLIRTKSTNVGGRKGELWDGKSYHCRACHTDFKVK